MSFCYTVLQWDLSPHSVSVLTTVLQVDLGTAVVVVVLILYSSNI